MSLRLYLDDDSASKLLARLLRDAGHEVTIPADAGLQGQDDDVHFAFAVRTGLVVLTRNGRDFADLHTDNPAHPGILVVYQDNDPGRDMSAADIVRAVGNLEAAAGPPGSGFSIAGGLHVLNDWRYAPPAP